MVCDHSFECFERLYFSDFMWNFIPYSSVLHCVIFHGEFWVFSAVWYVVMLLLCLSSWVVVDLRYAGIIVVVLWAARWFGWVDVCVHFRADSQGVEILNYDYF